MVSRVLVFGTFDGLHEGHIFFLKRAREFGETLFVAVARDLHVKTLKNKQPRFSENERLRRVQECGEVHTAYLSDAILGSFAIIDLVQPDLIILGFDQCDLKAALQEWMRKSKQNIDLKSMEKYA